MTAYELPDERTLSVLLQVPAFVQALKSGDVYSPSNPLGGRQAGRFIRELSRLNDDPSVPGIFPFMFFNTDEFGLSDSDALSLANLFKTEGLGKELLQVCRAGSPMVFFTHKAKPFADHVCSSIQGLAYSNLLGNGLVTQQMQMVGLCNASEIRMEGFARDAQALLRRIIN